MKSCRVVPTLVRAVACPLMLGVFLIGCRPAPGAGSPPTSLDAPTPPAAESVAADTATENAEAALADEVRQAIRADLGDALAAPAEGAPSPRFVFQSVELDGSGEPEVLVYLLGPPFCGSGGCDLKLLRRVEGALRVVQGFPITQTPVYLGAAQAGGSRLLLRSESGGGATPTIVIHRLEGQAFVEQSRANEAPPDAEVVFGDDTTYDAALSL